MPYVLLIKIHIFWNPRPWLWEEAVCLSEKWTPVGNKVVELFAGWSVSFESCCVNKSAIPILLVTSICMWNMLWKPEEVYLQVKDAVKTRGSLSGNETHVCLEVWTRHKQRHCKHSSGSGLQQQQPQKHSNLGINFGTIKIKQHYTEIWTSEINNSVWSTKIFHNQKVYFMLAGTYTTQRQTHKIMRNVSSRY